jgi:hypothetical protein
MLVTYSKSPGVLAANKHLAVKAYLFSDVILTNGDRARWSLKPGQARTACVRLIHVLPSSKTRFSTWNVAMFSDGCSWAALEQMPRVTRSWLSATACEAHCGGVTVNKYFLIIYLGI